MIWKISNRLSVWSFSFLIPTWITTDYRLACLHLVMTLSHPAPFVLVSFPKNKRCEPHLWSATLFSRVSCVYFFRCLKSATSPSGHPAGCRTRWIRGERVIYVRTDIVIHPREKKTKMSTSFYLCERRNTHELLFFYLFSLMIQK